MNWRYTLLFNTLITLCVFSDTQAESSDYFSGFYAGLEGGAISYNTQITFDGVDDPAGRGGFGYGACAGYKRSYQNLLIGAELLFNLPSEPDPYTFDPDVAGFSDLDLQRAASIGLDLQAGYIIIKRILIYGGLGYSANKQSVAIDSTPLDQFSGGAAAKNFGAFQFGLGLEFAIHPKLNIRTYVRTLSGHDLNASDFGTIPTDAALTFFDVEPSQQQFFTGLMFRF